MTDRYFEAACHILINFTKWLFENGVFLASYDDEDEMYTLTPEQVTLCISDFLNEGQDEPE